MTASRLLQTLRTSLRETSQNTRPRRLHKAMSVEPLEQRIVLENQPPENVVPSVQTVQVNQPLGFTEFRQNLISTSDPDAEAHRVKVTRTAAHGLIRLNYPVPNCGLTYSVVDGTSDVTMTLTGKISDINTALSWLVFHPDADYVGSGVSDTITTGVQG